MDAKMTFSLLVNVWFDRWTNGYARDTLIYDLMCVEKCICAMNMFAQFWYFLLSELLDMCACLTVQRR